MTRLRSRPGNPTIVLAIVLTVQLMIVLDASIVITALPEIHTDLGFSPTGLSWVQNAYTLTFGGLLLLGARAWATCSAGAASSSPGSACSSAPPCSAASRSRRRGCSAPAHCRASAPRSPRRRRSRC